MKSVLVAGGAGFVGSHLVDRLLKRSDVERLVVVDNLWTGQAENLSHIKDSRFSFERCSVETVRSARLFDEIYHLASPASPPWYMKEPEQTISANLVGAMAFLAKSRRHDAALKGKQNAIVRWWLLDKLGAIAGAACRLRVRELGFLVAETWGGVVGIAGEYDRSLARVQKIRELVP